MDFLDQQKILAQLVVMDPKLAEADPDKQWRLCSMVYNRLDNWEDYVLVEMVDAVTWETRWYWRRKT